MLPFLRPSQSNLKTVPSQNAPDNSPHHSLHLLASVSNRAQNEEAMWNEFAPTPPNTWQTFSAQIRIADFEIIGGLIYVGTNLMGRTGNEFDPCLIDPNLPVIAPQSDQPLIALNHLHPDYRQLMPVQRGRYLQWLSSGRNQPDIESGYILLYIYGLERRLLIDGPRERFSTTERLSILQELQRIVQIYGDRPEIFRSAYSMMVFSWISEKSPHNTEPIPDFIDFGLPECQPFFPWLLAKFVAQHRPVPATVFLAWYNHHPDFGLKGSSKSYPDLFSQVFQQKFSREVGPGIILSPNKTPLTIHYVSCNPVIGSIDISYPESCDVFKDKTFLSHLTPVIRSTENDLDSLIEYIQANGNDSTDPGIIARLPAELFIQNAFAQNLRNQLNQILDANNGMILLNVQSLYTAIGHAFPTQPLSRLQLDNWDKLLSRLGYLYAPNYQLHGTPLNKDGVIVISRSNSQPEFSRPFATMAVILRLGAMIAQVDNEICQKEIDFLQNMILARKVLSKPDRDSLILWLHWCLNTPQYLSDIERKLEKLPQPMIEHLSRVLISVACADGKIDPRERENLIEIYYKLGIPSSKVDADIQSCMNGEFEKQPKRKPQNVESEEESSEDDSSESQIEPQRLNSIPISLDLNKMLTSICSEPQSEMTTVFKSEIPNDKSLEVNSSQILDFDTDLVQFLNEIIDYPEIQRLKFFSIAVKHCLMGDRVIQQVNAWAAAHGHDAFMIDGEYTVKIDVQRLKRHLPQ